MIKEFLKESLPDGHYLKTANQTNSKYFDEFLNAIDSLKRKLPKKDFNDFWNNKLQFKAKNFNEKSFIQSACEVSVANYFCHHESFIVEAKVNPKNKKDVDCQFKSNGFTYNIEIKCASFDAKEAVEKSDSFKFQTYGRFDNKDDVISTLSSALDDGLKNQGKPLKEHAVLKNMDNNLKDFLESAHSKFNDECADTEINILLVCCNDMADVQSWIGYLGGPCGLLTNETFSDSSKYNNVDIILLTNLYFKHKDFYKKTISNSWSLEKSLNLFVDNPFRKKGKKNGIMNFGHEITNYNLAYNDFQVPGEAPHNVKEVVKTAHFVIDYLEKEKGLYLFGDKK